MPLRELTAGQEEQEKEEEGEAKDVASLADGFNIIITLVSTLDSHFPIPWLPRYWISLSKSMPQTVFRVHGQFPVQV